MNTFPLTISSPDGNHFEGDAAFLSLRGSEGDLAVMAGHVPFITAAKPGDCLLELSDGTVREGRLEDGLLTVAADRVTLLSGSFRWKE